MCIKWNVVVQFLSAYPYEEISFLNKALLPLQHLNVNYYVLCILKKKLPL